MENFKDCKNCHHFKICEAHKKYNKIPYRPCEFFEPITDNKFTAEQLIATLKRYTEAIYSRMESCHFDGDEISLKPSEFKCELDDVFDIACVRFGGCE